ncbi:PREDICTED: uncharacterized protein LOC108768206 [Trachymyrmex cornetzi]|uniref:uncharacterized protein LOC108768206 n=1 Tax=Trachymyrmex cornetzi TaxID=471704 RepID=UPI00084F0AD9|nr:PREDICTED: uncharacterized protein LOC108768206 [Trachymyrmex cornetzi]
MTMPKLELTAAHLMSKLMVKTFVRNRIADIQASSSTASWRHVPSTDNPADLASRGVSPKHLAERRLWWHGPSWLSESVKQWPEQYINESNNSSEMEETSIQSNVALLVTKSPAIIKFTNHSKLGKLTRIMAYCIRYINIVIHKRSYRSPLTAEEIQQATIVLVRLAQRESFTEEKRTLSAGKALSRRSKLHNLNAFLHEDNTLRVGGRLGRSDFNFDKRQPMILSSKHHLTKLVFESEHERLLHAGPQALLAQVKEQYWPISGRNLARQVVQRCIRCFRNKPKTITPQMADLHRDRVNPAPAFYNTGVDYAGPINTKDRKGRGGKIYKSYICLFICLTTKAIHLELVSNLSTEGFILALRRFVARRGIPNKISSDNGTNFVGAHSELCRLGEFLNKNENKLCDKLIAERINWSFILAYSPHFGGIWEAGIKSTKYYLKRVMGDASLTFEELYSLLVQIESILNSRPLSPLSSHPDDLLPLTPAHFLNFWKRWSKEFISELQCRTKWKTDQGTLKTEDLVLIKDDNLPPLRWRLGRVIELHPGIDSVARAATVKTAKGVIRRATVKLCPLPMETTPSEANPGLHGGELRINVLSV